MAGHEHALFVILLLGCLLRDLPGGDPASLYLIAGGLNDPDELLGLADFTASALMRGTQGRDFQQVLIPQEDILG